MRVAFKAEQYVAECICCLLACKLRAFLSLSRFIMAVFCLSAMFSHSLSRMVFARTYVKFRLTFCRCGGASGHLAGDTLPRTTSKLTRRGMERHSIAEAKKQIVYSYSPLALFELVTRGGWGGVTSAIGITNALFLSDEEKKRKTMVRGKPTI